MGIYVDTSVTTFEQGLRSTLKVRGVYIRDYGKKWRAKIGKYKTSMIKGKKW